VVGGASVCCMVRDNTHAYYNIDNVQNYFVAKAHCFRRG